MNGAPHLLPISPLSSTSLHPLLVSAPFLNLTILSEIISLTDTSASSPTVSLQPKNFLASGESQYKNKSCGMLGKILEWISAGSCCCAWWGSSCNSLVIWGDGCWSWVHCCWVHCCWVSWGCCCWVWRVCCTSVDNLECFGFGGGGVIALGARFCLYVHQGRGRSMMTSFPTDNVYQSCDNLPVSVTRIAFNCWYLPWTLIFFF